MPGIDDSRQFIPLKIAVLTISNTRALADDRSGATLVERAEKAGHTIAGRAIVTDDVEKIRARVKQWIADPAIDVIITTGGTGFTGRDVTPEAVEPLFEKRMAGFARRLPRRLGRDPPAPARLSLPSLQFRRDHAAPRGAFAPRQSQGRDRLAPRLHGSRSARAESIAPSSPRIARR